MSSSNVDSVAAKWSSERRTRFWALAILTVHGLLLARIAFVNAPVFDEVAHVPAGLSHWRYGNFDLYKVNPPLLRMIATLPLLVVRPAPELDWTGHFDGPFEHPAGRAGERYLKRNGQAVLWHIAVARLALIPVAMLGAWLCFRWATDLFGNAAGLLALSLWCFCPNILAWGSTITPDVGAATFGLAASYSFWRWLKQPTWRTASLAGLALGLAELSKSTWIILFLLWPVLWFGWQISLRLSHPDGTETRNAPAIQLFVALLVGWYLLNLGYGFEQSFQPLGSYEFISRTLSGERDPEFSGNRFQGHWLASVPVPFPANYVKGIDIQKQQFEARKWSYLAGERRFGGWYHYYLYALGVKTPVGTLALFLFSLCLLMSCQSFRLNWRDELVLWGPAIAVLALVSSQTGFNHYLRYVLPAVPFFYISISRVAKTLETGRPLPGLFCIAGILLSLTESLALFPHSMSFFNVAAGGPRNGPAHLLDGNIDWGQDLLELQRFLRRHGEAQPIRLAYYGVMDPSVIGITFEPFLTEDDEGWQPGRLTAGWYAISVNRLFECGKDRASSAILRRLRQRPPDALAGYSIYLYRLTAAEAAELSPKDD